MDNITTGTILTSIGIIGAIVSLIFFVKVWLFGSPQPFTNTDTEAADVAASTKVQDSIESMDTYSGETQSPETQCNDSDITDNGGITSL